MQRAGKRTVVQAAKAKRRRVQQRIESAASARKKKILDALPRVHPQELPQELLDQIAAAGTGIGAEDGAAALNKKRKGKRNKALTRGPVDLVVLPHHTDDDDAAAALDSFDAQGWDYARASRSKRGKILRWRDAQACWRSTEPNGVLLSFSWHWWQSFRARG